MWWQKPSHEILMVRWQGIFSMTTLATALSEMLICHANKVPVCVCYLVTERLVVGSWWYASRGRSLQLLGLLRIHGQHGNALYKGGRWQESEQCLTTTVTNSGEITLDICKKKYKPRKVEICKRGMIISRSERMKISETKIFPYTLNVFFV